jgi:hypothetical protein
MSGRGHETAFLIIASLVATALLVPAIPATDDHRHPLDNHSLYLSLNNSLQNKTLPDASFQREHRTAPSSITVYRFELDQASLPGPRYMAYGPNVISLEVDSRLLAVLITICAIFAGVWYLLQRKGEVEKVK